MRNEINFAYPQLESFLRALDRGSKQDRFSLIFVECNSNLVFETIINHIHSQTNLKCDVIDLIGIDESDDIYLDQYLKGRIESDNLKNPIFIKNFDSWIPYFDDNENTKKEKTLKNISSLNWRRNYFRELNRTIIFWLPSYALELIAEQAPDFYDWYSDLFEFKNKNKFYYVINDLFEDDGYNTPLTKNLDKEVKKRKIRELFSLLEENLSKDERLNILKLIFNMAASMDNYVLSFQMMRLLNEMLPDLEEEEGIKYNNTMGYIFLKQGNLKEAFEYLEKARKDIKLTNDLELKSSVNNNLGAYYRAKNDFINAEKYFKRASKILKNYPIESKIHIYLNIIAIDIELNNYEKAIKDSEKIIPLLENVGDMEALSSAYNNIAYAYAEKKQLDIAYSYFNKSMKISKNQGDRSGEAIALYNLAEFMYKQKYNIDYAERYYREALKLALEVNNKKLIGDIYSAIAHFLFARKDFDESLQMYEKAIDFYKKDSEFTRVSQALLNVAAIYSRLECFEMEEKTAEMSLEYAHKSGNPTLIEMILRVLKTIYIKKDPLN